MGFYLLVDCRVILGLPRKIFYRLFEWPKALIVNWVLIICSTGKGNLIRWCRGPTKQMALMPKMCSFARVGL
jgi:hypothetical protein